MPDPVVETWAVEFVQFRPGAEDVLIGGNRRVIAPSGNVVASFENVRTTQADLTARAVARDADVWDDADVAAEVEAQTGVPAA